MGKNSPESPHPGSPKGQKSQKREPKAGTQSGSLGVFPAKSMARPWLEISSCDSLITFSGEATAGVPLSQSKGVQPLNVQPGALPGLYSGLSDAFYRGKLPQVLFFWLDVGQLRESVDELCAHVDKLRSLGYFSSNSTLQGVDPLDIGFPYVILLGEGFLIQVFRSQFQQQLNNVSISDYQPGLAERIQGKVLRGAFVPASSSSALAPKRLFLAKAGEKIPKAALESCLQAHQFLLDLSTDVSEIALEYQQWAYHILERLLPNAHEAGCYAKASIVELRQELCESLHTLGLMAAWRSPMDSPQEWLPLAPWPQSSDTLQSSEKGSVQWKVLRHYYELYDCEWPAQILDPLIEIVQ